MHPAERRAVGLGGTIRLRRPEPKPKRERRLDGTVQLGLAGVERVHGAVGAGLGEPELSRAAGCA